MATHLLHHLLHHTRTLIYFIRRTTTKCRRIITPIRTTAVHPSSTYFISVAESHLFHSSLNDIEMSDLVNATLNFSPELISGVGIFGVVYKATLASGVTVAVKKLSSDDLQEYPEFQSEMETLGRIQHDNIVKLFGYCATGSDRILVYEFIENGSLDQWLYDTSSTHDGVGDVAALRLRLPLCWNTRIGVMKGVAKGLAFLHSLERHVIYLDINVSNVLLDADFEAHLADFGLARRRAGSLHQIFAQMHEIEYIPPEYETFYVASVRGDVYSFGVLMFEIVTARPPNRRIQSENGEQIRFVEWATRMVSKNQEMKMLDARMLKEDLKEREVLEFLRIAMLCTNEIPKLRPSMNEVVKLLDHIQDETTI